MSVYVRMFTRACMNIHLIVCICHVCFFIHMSTMTHHTTPHHPIPYHNVLHRATPCHTVPQVRARRAVISNADVWGTRRLVVGHDATLAGTVRARLATELQVRMGLANSCQALR